MISVMQNLTTVKQDQVIHSVFSLQEITGMC